MSIESINNNLIHPPFTSTKLQGEKKLDKVQIVLNPEDRETLNKLKELIGENKDASAFRIVLFYSYNLLLREFGGKIGVRLFKKRLPKGYQDFTEI